ncbi:MAG: (5-formylfuran-3-yl)methyl phosphate synthase, partial [Methylohalobius sp.]|nr:(5-formylfuran-3-yl)methyl phosphate synthase [Methylohalobius sp.]
MIRLLISVTDLKEARQATCADLIDLKNPVQGALGALPVKAIQAIRQALPGHKLSATVGDLPLVPKEVVRAADEIAATGVDYVKIGLFEGDVQATLQALSPLARRTKLVGVILADRPADFSVLEDLAHAGFTGAMLDTADKRRGSLTELRPLIWIQEFVKRARELGLLAGLAGSLRLEDVPRLTPLKPDYLGFRSAACQGGQRTSRLDPQRLHQLHQAIREPLPADPNVAVPA